MFKVDLKFFGPARDIVGETNVTLEIDEGETLGGLAGILSEKYPKLGAALGIRLAVNRKYAALDHKLSGGDEIAVIPPVSGG